MENWPISTFLFTHSLWSLLTCTQCLDCLLLGSLLWWSNYFPRFIKVKNCVQLSKVLLTTRLLVNSLNKNHVCSEGSILWKRLRDHTALDHTAKWILVYVKVNRLLFVFQIFYTHLHLSFICTNFQSTSFWSYKTLMALQRFLHWAWM